MRSEKRLMLAILEDAVVIYKKYARVPGRRHECLVAETERWLFSDDTAWPFSFVNVCSALEFDVASIRERLVGNFAGREAAWDGARRDLSHGCHDVR
jgi:hypothetical protein